ncbi:MAG: molybdopterin oxidoreductase family protein [Planctomycetota bacterium]|nr:molybdopterin oxidoreductase family protein [Planctomycetota bacterium]
MSESLHYRNCHLCEAMCGLEITVKDGEVSSIIGDKQDPFSGGYICPKATALADLHNDPNRLRQPVRRIGDQWETISWDDAFSLITEKIQGIQSEFGRDAFGVYLGNPAAHNYGIMIAGIPLLKTLKTRNRFSASSVDQLPHMLVAYLMYGHQFLIPIPDIDRTDYFLIMGGNPLASNGSLMTVPNVRKRLKAVLERGTVVVIDPRATETAKVASEHHFIRPATDAAFLAAMIHTLFAEKLVDLALLEPISTQFETLEAQFESFTPESVASWTGIDAETIKRLTRDFAKAPSAVCYGRMGLSTQIYGTLCQWLIQLVNILTGNVDRPGGAMFTKPAFDLVGSPETRRGHYNVWQSRVSQYPECHGELPAAALAEEILTPGEGQIRGLMTIAGNPVLSTPNGKQLEKALDQLDFMVSIDPYINESTRHADIILPPSSPLQHNYFDMVFPIFAVRNTVKYSPATLPIDEGTLHDWEILRGLSKSFCAAMDIDPGPDFSPDQVVDGALRMGPYGQGHEKKLSLKALKEHPHGMDLGALQAQLPERLQTKDKKIALAPPMFVSDLKRLTEEMEKNDAPELVLIGRRHLRSNNSWMHNSLRLVKGEDRCVLLVHPDDLAKRQLKDGQLVTARSRVGSLRVMAKASLEMMPGVVSLPHGWGHDREGIQLDVAAKHPGVSVNDITDDKALDPLSGNAAVNGVPIELLA